MDRVAVFVDAGYLFAQGSLELCGRKLERRHVSLDHRALIDALKEFAERTSGLPLLRIYWYDGTSQGPNSTSDLYSVDTRSPRYSNKNNNSPNTRGRFARLISSITITCLPECSSACAAIRANGPRVSS